MAVGRLLPEAVRNFFRRPATVLYPRCATPVPDGFRGAPALTVENCIGCRICARQCPAGAIEMQGEQREARPAFHHDHCIFCGVCAEVCPRKAIEMSRRFELAEVDRRNLFKPPG